MLSRRILKIYTRSKTHSFGKKANILDLQDYCSHSCYLPLHMYYLKIAICIVDWALITRHITTS